MPRGRKGERQRDRASMRDGEGEGKGGGEGEGEGKLTSVKLLMPLADEIISKLCLCCCLEANGLFA